MRQRIAITLLCLTLATTLVSSISLYVDSASIDEWNEQIDIGPVSMMVSGDGIEGVLDEIEEIPGIQNVSGLVSAHGYIARLDVLWGFELTGNVYALTDDYLEKFPTTFILVHGRWPQNETEIAIPLTIANQAFIGPGSFVNYSFNSILEPTPLTVVGTYEQTSGDLYSHYYYSSIAVVTENRLDSNTMKTRAYLHIDETPINPYNAYGALTYLNTIGDEIRSLYPGYPELIAFSRFAVNDYLSIGIRNYIEWRNTARSEQILRSAGVVLMVLLMVVLALRYNLSDRTHETSFLRARGATERRIELLIIRDILGLAALSCVLGIIFGILASRIALISTGYLQFNTSIILTAPVLISQETLVMIILVSFGLPMAAYSGIKFASAGKKHIDEGRGRLGKISKGLKIIQWDMGILVIALAFMFAFYSSISLIQQNLLSSLIFQYLPVPVYLSVTSLVMKGLKKGTDIFSKIAGKPFGKISASIGVRRIGQTSKSAGLVIMVIVLAITLSWNNAIANTSLVESRENHAKFALGGDIVFHLERDQSSRWNEFIENVTTDERVIATTTISMKKLFLSSGYSGIVDCAILTPEEYRQVGYDFSGNRLNETYIGDLLLQMAGNPTAVIISQDIAEEYEVDVGDSIKAFKTTSDLDFFTFSIIAVVEALPHPLVPDSTYIPTSSGYAVGAHLIWINSLYASEKINLVDETNSYLSVATCETCNDTSLAINLLKQGGKEIIYGNDWAAVDYELDSYTSSILYRMDRALDSMLTIVSIFIVIGVMTVYASESIRDQKREAALLKSLGADGKAIARAQFAELGFLIILSLGLVSLYSPIFVTNSLLASINSYTSWSFIFPVTMFVVVPWGTLAFIVLFYLLCMFGQSLVIARQSTKVGLREALSSYWTKGCPIVGSEN